MLCAATVVAQQGDKAEEKQAPPPAWMKIPPAPPLAVEEALKTFQIAPGFKIEVVASDPMIEAPVEIEFAPDGSLYVLEMRSFMPNVDGTGEDQPLGRISHLRDTDGDGRMDASTAFVDGLIMPRAIGVARNGLLVAEPPHLWFFADTDGDGRADEKRIVSSDYGNQKNPEHNANGLIWARDNWVYSANHNVRYRDVNGEWEKSPTSNRGQWGISQDDYGRLFFNSNSDQLRADLVPGNYLTRNPNLKNPFGGNVQIAKDQTTFPGRINPGVNRGYQQGTLKEDGRLAKFTGACGPVIYRGDLFPNEYYGAAFLCEPTGNFVRANFIREQNGLLTATNAFPEREFLASTDERFRPVNLFNGPDGALYVVDMYRGVIQHKIYITTFLRNQALERGLDKPLNLGRIYRIVPEDAHRPAPMSLAKMTSAELVEKLSTGNGWVRDTAQQLLVERNDHAVLSALNTLVSAAEFPAAVHALWVLHGMGETGGAGSALKAQHPKVRAAAVRVLEPAMRGAEWNETARMLASLTNDPSSEVRLQLMLTLGESKLPEAEEAMMGMLTDENLAHPLMPDAAASGLAGRELPVLRKLLAQQPWNSRTGVKANFIRKLARCAAESREPALVSDLLDLAAAREPVWQQLALLDGLTALVPAKEKGQEKQEPKPVKLPAQPAGLAKLASAKNPDIETRLATIEPLLQWPGKGGAVQAEAKALTEAEQKLFDAGKTQFLIVCGACHQPNGMGLDGLAPPLVDSPWVNGDPKRLTRIALQGIRGPLKVKGKIWELEMPALNVLSDEEIAGLLTYVRREWGHTAPPVSPEFVGQIRKETEDRFEAWTEEELLKLK